MIQCPICQGLSCNSQPSPAFSGVEYDCARCGRFVLCGTIAHGFAEVFFNAHRRTVFSHRLRSMQGDKAVVVVEKELNSFRLDDALPTPAEQADRLILWIASHQSLSGEWVENSIAEIDAWIGAAIASPGVTQGWLLDEEDVKKFIEAQTPVNARRKFRLTFAGWKHYETIKEKYKQRLHEERLEFFFIFIMPTSKF